NGESISESIVFFLGIFNGVQMLYAREGINLRLHSIKVWDQPDNFSTTNGSTALRSFRDYIRDTQVNPSWNVAVLVSRYRNEDSSAPNGGLANIDGLCNSAKRQAYANINVSTDSFPDFSWSVFLISHEIGHTIGAPHSHNCSWPEGPLDNCYCPEGDCPDGPSVATTGGTIMSYCYLSRPFQSSCPEFPSGTNPGVNFLLGFGNYPRALMHRNILEAGCLDNKSFVELPNLQSDTATTFVQVNDSLVIKGLRIWNNGSTEVDSFLVQLNQAQIGFTDTLETPDLLLRLPGIKANDTLEIDTTLLWSSVPATHWTWIVDPQQGIREWHEGDNWVQQDLQRNYQFPQLALSMNAGLEDSTFYFKLNQFDLQNVGGDDAAPIQITYFLSSDRELDEADVLIGTNNNQWLPKQGKLSFPLVFLKPDLAMPEGRFYLIAKAELIGADIPLAYPNTWTIVLEESIQFGPPKFRWFRN
ncbi:MAG: M12 family metallo-peptidase, partial [Bacteroidota bacterium]